MIKWLSMQFSASGDRAALDRILGAANESTISDRPDAPGNVERYRAIFISDIHLGTRGCKAAYLLDFLRHHESDALYLVGDIVDGWSLRKTFYWPQSHNDVVGSRTLATHSTTSSFGSMATSIASACDSGGRTGASRNI